jgi:hypothetical protein
MSAFRYRQDSFNLISEVLIARSKEMCAPAYSLESDIVTAAACLDPAGPLTWALTIHADAIARLSGISPVGANMLPYTMIEDDQAPYGNRCVMQPGSIAAAVAINFIDAALEHCICIGMQHLGTTPEEWRTKSFSHQVIPIEPYFEELKLNWVSEELESAERTSLLINLPSLQTRESLQKLMVTERLATSEAMERPRPSRAVAFGGMR